MLNITKPQKKNNLAEHAHAHQNKIWDASMFKSRLKKPNGKQKLYHLCETIRLPFRCFVESTLFTSLRRKNAIRHSHFEPGHQFEAKTVSITRVQKNIETNGTKPCWDC